MKTLLTIALLTLAGYNVHDVWTSDVPMAPWNSARKAGSSLDGGWYRADHDGCFADQYVLRIEGSTVHAHIDDDTAPLAGVTFETHSYPGHREWVRVRWGPGQGAGKVVWYRDYGNRLDAAWIEIDGERVRLGDGAFGFARCDAPTWA